MKHSLTILNEVPSLILCLFIFLNNSHAQNSLTGDGFGGRSWYVAHNYQAGAYGAYTVCGNDNQLYGWGGNDYFELGTDIIPYSDVAIAIPNMNNVKFYSTGYASGVIKNDNTAWVWGGGFYSGLPITPTYMLSDVRFIDGGVNHVVFVKNDSTVWGVGKNQSGALGNGTHNSTSVPVQMIGINNAVRAIAVGSNEGSLLAASIILLADGTVKISGGYNWFTSTNTSIPVIIPGLNNIIDVKGGASAAFALNSIGQVYSFGKEFNTLNPFNPLGTLGLGTFTGVFTPPTLLNFPLGSNPIIAISANNDGLLALALDENGNVYGWGDNRFGQLGDGTFDNVSTPKLIATNAIDIFAGETFTYILKADNTIWATGASGYSVGGGSVWMNLTNEIRNRFTQINPVISPMNLCVTKPFGNICTANLNFGKDTFLCQGERMILNTEISNANYLWQNNSTSSSYTITKAGIYWVKVVKNGCEYKDTIIISSKNCSCIQLIPRVFTPNGDGIYDKWVIDKHNCVKQIDVSVYNRYGSLVFQKRNYQNDWNGTWGFKPLPDATYYYIVRVFGLDGNESILKGDLTIVR